MHACQYNLLLLKLPTRQGRKNSNEKGKKVEVFKQLMDRIKEQFFREKKLFLTPEIQSIDRLYLLHT